MATNYKKKKNRVIRSKSKKRTNRRRAGPLTITRPQISSSGLPQNYPMKMKYSTTLNITLPAYPLNVCQQFNLNSIYDPDRTGTGHQPYFRDQMAQFYDFYKVLGCKVTINCTVLQAHCNVVFRADDNTTVVSNFTLEQERPGATKCLVCQPPVKNIYFKKYFSIPKVLRISPKEYRQDDTLKTAIGSNPSASYPAILNILFENADHAGSADTIIMNAVLEYDVMLMDLTVQSQS